MISKEQREKVQEHLNFMIKFRDILYSRLSNTAPLDLEISERIINISDSINHLVTYDLNEGA